MSRTLRDVALYLGAGGVISAMEAVLAPPRTPNTPLSPPAPAIGAAWSALFALFGIARARLSHAPRPRRQLDLLWLLCVFYPLYTRGQRSRPAELVGNAAIAGQAWRVIGRARRTDPAAATLVAAVLPWVAYATAIVLTDHQRRGRAGGETSVP